MQDEKSKRSITVNAAKRLLAPAKCSIDSEDNACVCINGGEHFFQIANLANSGFSV